MKLFVCALVLALVVVPRPAFAQAHPCDATPVVNPSLTSPVVIQWCSDLKDVTGATTVVTAWTVTVNTTVLFTGALTPVGPVSASGKWLYETAPLVPPVLSPPQGNVGPHTVTVAATNVTGSSGPSAPFAFTIILPPPPPVPTKPTVLGIRK